MNEIVGHGKILSFFDKVIKNDNLSHAYIFTGPNQVGKKEVAKKITSELLQVEKNKVENHPDYNFIQQSFDKKTGKTKKNITVTQMKEFREWVARRAYFGNYKIAIIDGAEKMNIGAANALLKTLEEPSEKTLIFLVSSNDQELPQTIRSRCQTIYFSLVPEEDMKKISTEQEKIKLSIGRPGRLKQWLEKPEEFEDYKKEVERFNSLFNKSFFEKIKIIEDLFGDKSDHINTRNNLDKVLQIWQLQIHDRILKKTITKENENFLQIEKQIEKTREFLQKNIHPRLLVENILLLIP